MTGHFDKNLNLRQLILDKRPQTILECGAGNGDCTRLLLHLKHWYDFDLMVISDKDIEDLSADPDIEWITGVSYREIKKLPDNSLGLVILDTDHNYWTLKQELEALIPKMEEGGLIVMHDVDDFYYSTGMGMSYWNDEPYPEKEIEGCAKLGGLGLCLIDFLSAYRGSFKLLRWIQEHHGCAVIEKKTITETQVIKPGSEPIFAKPQKQEDPNAVTPSLSR